MLLGAAVALLVGSGVSYYFLEARPAASAHAVPVDALYNLALDAGSALAGDAAALTGFEQRQKQLEEAAARDPAAPFTSDVRFTRLMSNAAAIVRARGALAGAGGAARETATLVPRLLGEASALAGALPAGTATAVSGTLERFAAGLGILRAGLGATLRMRRTVERQRLSAEAQRRESDRNQQAILRLLDELSSLADGDLTVQATVTEDITGAIADSINYAVDALRGLVSAINGSAIQLDSATRQTQALSQHLSRASGAQSKQIASATESICYD